MFNFDKYGWLADTCKTLEESDAQIERLKEFATIEISSWIQRNSESARKWRWWYRCHDLKGRKQQPSFYFALEDAQSVPNSMKPWAKQKRKKN